MMNILTNIWNRRSYFRSFFKTVYFNFHYLPFSQAIHLPILLYKPRFLGLKGTVVIQCLGGVKCGMIKLGFDKVSIFPNNGIMWENRGGTIIFHGNCSVGNNSSLSIGEKGICEFGTNMCATTTFRVACYHKVLIGDNVSFGWDCMVIDTDFHKLTKLAGGYNKGYAPIMIGNNNWFGNGCLIMKRTVTPNYCTISAKTVLSERVEAPEYSVIGQKNDIEIKSTGIYRNFKDDKITF